MTSILLYLGTCIAGYLIAIPMRKKKEYLTWVGTVQTVAVLALVFTMGARIGANREVASNLGSYGLYALIFTLVILAFSVASVFIARKLMGIDRYGHMAGDPASGARSEAKPENDQEDSNEEDSARGPIFDKTTVMIVLFVIAGIVAGFIICNYIYTDFEKFNDFASKVITAGLMVLLLFVGIDLGLEGEVIGSIKRAGLRVIVIPFVVMAGTLIGALLCGLFLPVTIKESLAIGAGYGWYSLAPGIIMDAGYVSAGAISFMHNVMREVIGIIAIPIIARLVGYVECVSLPGAAAMDVCLPIVERATNGSTAVYSFVSGVILSIAVPIMVPIFV